MLSSKTILVAGAGGLLGSTLIQQLLNAGAHVLATDLPQVDLAQRLQSRGISTAGHSLQLAKLDLNRAQDIDQLLSQELLDGVVNCSYPRNSSYGQPLEQVSLASFNENLALHLGSAFLLMQRCALHFQQQPRQLSLVNLASVYGVIAPRFELYQQQSFTMPVEYAAIKSALIHLTKYMVKYVSDSRFRVNLVSPGGLYDQQPDSFVTAYRQYSCGTGMLQPKDICGAVLFLLSDQSQYITGQNLIVDDGFTL